MKPEDKIAHINKLILDLQTEEGVKRRIAELFPTSTCEVTIKDGSLRVSGLTEEQFQRLVRL